MSALDFMVAFSNAAAVPVTRPVKWPTTIPEDHPVRALGLTTRYWPVPVALHLQQLADEAKPGWIGRTYWYIIAATVCKKDGSSAFCDNWPTIFQGYAKNAVDSYTQAFDKWQADPDNADKLFPEQEPKFQLDDDGNYAVPSAPDYYIVGDWLKSQFDTAQGASLMRPMWESAMDYNGWSPTDSKNSETTDSSQPSGEKPTAGE